MKTSGVLTPTILIVMAVLLDVYTSARAQQPQPPPQPRGEGRLEAQGAPPFTFVVIGDTRPGLTTDPDDPAAVSIIYLEHILWINRLRPDFTINVGDIVKGYNTKEPGLLERQLDAFDRAGMLFKQPYYMVVGNHEVWDAYSQAIYTRRYGPLYYSFDHKQCHFTVLSAEPAREESAIDANQLAWLEKDLAGAQDARFRFVFLHRPFWSGGPRYGKTTDQWRQQVHPLLLQHKVDTVFAGHDHYYEYSDIDGVRCLITGGGGAELRGTRIVGGFHHFLKVEVPDTSAQRPTITVVERAAEYPDTIVVAGVRPKLEATLKGLAFDSLLLQEAGPASQVLSLSITNRFEKELVFNAAWKTADDQPAAVAPAVTEAVIQPGTSQTIAFAFDCRGRTLKPSRCRWSLTLGDDQLLAQDTAVVPVSKRGFFSEPVHPAVMRIDDRSQVVTGADKWTGSADCSAAAQVSKSDAGWTVTVDVTDDRLKTDNKHDWSSDSVELYFDVRPDGRRGGTTYQQGVFQVIVVPKSTATHAVSYTFYPDQEKSAVPGTTVKTEIIEGTGYRIEMFLPFAGMQQNHYLPGDAFHFTFCLNDADTGESESRLIWCGTTLNYCNPSAFGRISSREARDQQP